VIGKVLEGRAEPATIEAELAEFEAIQARAELAAAVEQVGKRGS